MAKQMEVWVYAAFLVLNLICEVNSTGKFYVGLLQYDNPSNLDYLGNCCDGESGPGATCIRSCDLIFEITVVGLDRSPASRRLSNKPVTNSSVSFSSSYEGINPVSFNFTRWPDEVNITVSVYDKDDGGENTVLELVDRFHTRFSHQGSGHFYILKPLNGQRSKNASSLIMLFRYKCDKTVGPNCFTDCMDHAEDEVCPLTPPPGTDMTYTYPICSPPDNGSSSFSNCSARNLTVSVTTMPILESTKETVMILVNQTTKSNKIVSNASEVFNQSTTQNILNTSLLHDKSSAATPKVSIRTTKTTSQSIFIQEIISTQSSPAQVIPGTHSTDPTLGTPPTDQYVYVDKGMDYWPAIVGGVLGGLALLAAAGFLLYYKRQKKLQKRQEIYNVNPKILRKFEEYAENGTSGRADVPLETEQV